MRLINEQIMVKKQTYIALPLIAMFLMITVSSVKSDPLDQKVHKQFSNELYAITNKYIPKDDTYLLGRNFKWKKLYSPRFQMGAGRAIRIALSKDDIERSFKAYMAIIVGTESIDHAGRVKSSIPKNFGKLKLADELSAASFYLGDSCQAFLHVEKHKQKNIIIKNNSHHIKIKEKVLKAILWLEHHSETLKTYDLSAPNRLLFDARAFYSCGLLFNNKKLLLTGSNFTDLAIKSLSNDGYFIEKMGWDTSYQAVAINVGIDILLSGIENKKLENALNKASLWLSDRINNHGNVNSYGNKRTCADKEEFFNVPKQVAIDEVFLALAYTGTQTKNTYMLKKAENIVNMYKKNPKADPCSFEKINP